MRIAVIGATRGIGLALVKLALAEGHEVTALVRTPDRMPVSDKRLRLVTGDAHDRGAVMNAAEGQDVVCDCLGTSSLTKKITLFSDSAKNLAEVLKPEQLLIAVTGIGTGDSSGHGGFLYDHLVIPIVLRRIYADKNRQESIIRERLSRWIVVRPGFLTNGPRTGRYRVITDLQGVRAGKISRMDVADFILSQARSPQFIRQTPLLTY